MDVPSVGCPAKGNSWSSVKIRTLTTLFALCGGIARKDERGFLHPRFARELLHFVVRQAAGVGEHGELVALQPVRREDIDLNIVEATGIGGQGGSLRAGANVRDGSGQAGSTDLEKSATCWVHGMTFQTDFIIGGSDDGRRQEIAGTFRDLIAFCIVNGVWIGRVGRGVTKFGIGSIHWRCQDA